MIGRPVLVPLLLAAVVGARAAGDDELLAFEAVRFEEVDRQATFRGRIASRLPDGGHVQVWLRFRGHNVVALSRRFRIAGGAVEFELGPVGQQVLSGTYEMMARYDHQRQPRSYWRQLEAAGIEPGPIVDVAREFVVRQADLSDEERRALDEQYREIWRTASVLIEEAERFRDAPEEDFDAEELARFRSGLSGRIGAMGRIYEGLLDAYLVLPEQTLHLSLGAIFQHLSIVVGDIVGGRGGSVPPAGGRDEGDDPLTTDDRLHHVRQVLRGLAIHLGEAEMNDEEVMAQLRLELGTYLDQLAHQADLDEAARATWFEGWSVEVASIGQGLIVAEAGEELLRDFRRQRREVVGLGQTFRDTGQMGDLDAMRERLGLSGE